MTFFEYPVYIYNHFFLVKIKSRRLVNGRGHVLSIAIKYANQGNLGSFHISIKNFFMPEQDFLNCKLEIGNDFKTIKDLRNFF